MPVAEAPLHVLVDRAIRSCCKFLSFEYSHLDSWEQQEWLRREAEELSEQVLPREKRWAILKHLFRAGVSSCVRYQCSLAAFTWGCVRCLSCTCGHICAVDTVAPAFSLQRYL